MSAPLSSLPNVSFLILEVVVMLSLKAPPNAAPTQVQNRININEMNMYQNKTTRNFSI